MRPDLPGPAIHESGARTHQDFRAGLLGKKSRQSVVGQDVEPPTVDVQRPAQ